jgi:hypothetical protein
MSSRALRKTFSEIVNHFQIHMTSKRQSEYIGHAEKQIDLAWDGLELFKFPLPKALTALVTATDDRIRIAQTARVPFETQMWFAVRWSQDALVYGVPELFKRCKVTEEDMPAVLSEEEYAQGHNLAEFAEAYDSAVIAFTNFHLGRFGAKAIRRQGYLAFFHASSETRASEIEKKAYETFEMQDVPEGILTAEGLKPLRNLIHVVEDSFCTQGSERVALVFSEQLIAAMRQVRDVSRRLYVFNFDEASTVGTITLGDARRYFCALSALGHAQEFLHLSKKAVFKVPTGAVSSLALRMQLTDLNSIVAAVAEMPAPKVAEISALLTYDGSLAVPVICQPLFKPNSKEVIIPRAFTLASRFERNLMKLLARHPSTKKAYSKFSSNKEGVALPRVQKFLEKRGMVTRLNIELKESGKMLTDIDVLAFDREDGTLLIIQHKWLIEPDSVNESKDADKELENGIEQARKVLRFLSASPAQSRSVMPELPPDGPARLRAIVVCKGLEPSGFLLEREVPVVTERWFEEEIASLRLGALYDKAILRPDRTKIAQEFGEISMKIKIGEYKLSIPAIARYSGREKRRFS